MWCICRFGRNLNMALDQKSHKSFQQVQTQTLLQEHCCSQSKAGIGFKSIPACQNFRCITGSCWHKNHYINNYSPPSIRTRQQKNWREFRHKPENPPSHRRIASAFQNAFQFTRRQSVKFRLKQSDWKKKNPSPLSSVIAVPFQSHHFEHCAKETAIDSVINTLLQHSY